MATWLAASAPAAPQTADPLETTEASQQNHAKRSARARAKLLAALKEAEEEALQASDGENAGRVRRWIVELQKSEQPESEPGAIVLLKQTGEDLSPSPWRYTERDPGRSWTEAGFNDTRWRVGMTPFGDQEAKAPAPRTLWSSGRIWLRTTFGAPSLKPTDRMALRIRCGDDAEVYINGRLCVKRPGGNSDYEFVTLTSEQSQPIRRGENTLAVTCRNASGRQVIDVGILLHRGK